MTRKQAFFQDLAIPVVFGIDYLTYFGPKVITACLLLEAECQVTRVILSPHDEGLLEGRMNTHVAL